MLRDQARWNSKIKQRNVYQNLATSYSSGDPEKNTFNSVVVAEDISGSWRVSGHDYIQWSKYMFYLCSHEIPLKWQSKKKKTSWTHKDKGNGKGDASKILSTNVWKLEREWMSGNQPQSRERWIKKATRWSWFKRHRRWRFAWETATLPDPFNQRLRLSHPDAKRRAVFRPFPCLVPGTVAVRLVPFTAPLTPRSRRLVGSFQGWLSQEKTPTELTHMGCTQ